MNYKNLTLEKGMYCNPNKSFSQILEELDPSENYVGSGLEKLDAFQRQLKRFDIKVNGQNSDFVSKFFENSNSVVLFPEFLARCVKNGIDSHNILDLIVATKIKIDSLNYRNIEIDSKTEQNAKLEIVEEGAQLPEIQLKINEDSIQLKKFARMLTASYETIEFQRINSFSIALKRIGRCLGTTIVSEALKILIEGDSKSNPAKTIETNSEKISYEDLIKIWTEFGDFEMNTIVASPNLVAEIAKIEELRNPLSKHNFPTNGSSATPLGANLIRTNVAPKDSIIFLDNNFALNLIIAKGLTVEADKVIEKQISRTAIYTTLGFTKICKDASCILKISQK